MATLVRAAALTCFEDVARQCGLDPRALLAEVGLSARCLDDPDLKVSAASVVTLLELAAERGKEPAFGLRMAESRRLSNLGVLGLLVRDQATLRRALEALVRYIHVHAEAMTVSLEQSDGFVIIQEEMSVDDSAPTRQAIEMAMGTTFRVLSIFLGSSWRPRHVCFVHPAPRSAAIHRRVFGQTVEFGKTFNGIVCNAADLEAPNPGADPVMARYANRLLEQVPRKHTRMSDRVRQLIVLLLPRGRCKADVIGQHLGVGRRTVANHLASERTTFTKLVDEIRHDLLVRYLKDGERSLSEIAALLGFSALSAFSRWHQNQFGAAARMRPEYRRERR